MDGMASLTDTDIAAMQAEQALARPSLFAEEPRRNQTHELFQYDKYDWTGWEQSNPAYLPLVLSRGYFSFVDADRYDEIRSTFSHYVANVQLERETGEIRKIYAAVGGNGYDYTYLHRYIVGASDRRQIVDHRLGLSLDNREGALNRGSFLRNVVNHDSSSRRSTNTGLKRGVYPVSGGKFKAQIKRKLKTYRSEETFDTEDAAHEWYRRIFKRLFRVPYVDIARPEVQAAGFPLFPPLKDSVIPF
jgi:hypothetical protein